MKKQYLGLLQLFAASLVSLNTHATQLLYDLSDTNLIGANEVSIDGGFFDVEFLSGTCASVFDGCSSRNKVLDFTTEASARTAAQSLLNQVIKPYLNDRYFHSNSSTGGVLHIPYDLSVQYDWIYQEDANGNLIKLGKTVGDATVTVIDLEYEYSSYYVQDPGENPFWDTNYLFNILPLAQTYYYTENTGGMYTSFSPSALTDSTIPTPDPVTIPEASSILLMSTGLFLLTGTMRIRRLK